MQTTKQTTKQSSTTHPRQSLFQGKNELPKPRVGFKPHVYMYTHSLTPRTARALSPRGEREIDLLPEEQCSQCPLRSAGVAEVAVQPATLGPGHAPQHQLHHLQSRVRETPGKEGTCIYMYKQYNVAYLILDMGLMYACIYI